MDIAATDHLTTEQQYQEAYGFLTGLAYHNLLHTVSVTAATQHLAKEKKISRPGALLLLTAALFQDAGFIKGYKDHGVPCCNLAREVLPLFGYPAGAIGMPGRSGLKSAGDIKKKFEFPPPVAVMLTAYSDGENYNQAMHRAPVTS